MVVVEVEGDVGSGRMVVGVAEVPPSDAAHAGSKQTAKINPSAPQMRPAIGENSTARDVTDLIGHSYLPYIW